MVSITDQTVFIDGCKRGLTDTDSRPCSKFGRSQTETLAADSDLNWATPDGEELQVWLLVLELQPLRNAAVVCRLHVNDNDSVPAELPPFCSSSTQSIDLCARRAPNPEICARFIPHLIETIGIFLAFLLLLLYLSLLTVTVEKKLQISLQRSSGKVLVGGATW